jgi:hypothetical protein
MSDWRQQLEYDPLPRLLSSENKAIAYFSRRDLLEEEVDPIETLWELIPVRESVRRQQKNGSWRFHGNRPGTRWKQNYEQLETFRIFSQLVEKHGMTKDHRAIMKAADFMFRSQTEEGDFRGTYGNQYTPNYSGAILEVLVKAGYGEDPRVEKGFRWLLSIRQSDGGWALPLQTVGAKLDRATMASDVLKPDLKRPFSHLVTGMVLRAFAAHERYRETGAARVAGGLLASSFFKRGKYPGRQDASYWTRFSFPFWFTDLLSSLDSLSLLGFTLDDPQIRPAAEWLVGRQGKDGLWKLTMLKGADPDLPLWIALVICRALKRLYG